MDIRDTCHAFLSLHPQLAADAGISGSEGKVTERRNLVAVKDNICTKDFPTTCGSKMLAGFVPPADAFVIKKLRAADMVVAGKTNMDEFAMGSTTETSYFGATLHPHNPAYAPGGSSGGSAAAVAAGYVDMALGSDTGGSIRLPAAHCGIVGLKPTYGLVSRNGLVAYASSMDQIGPMGRSVSDCARLLEVIAGFDEEDATSRCTLQKAKTYRASLRPALAGMKIGIPADYLGEQLSPDVRCALERTARMMQSLGAVTEEMRLGMAEYVSPVYYILACGEASSNLQRYDGVRYGYRGQADDLDAMYRRTRGEGFGSEVKRRILLGTYVLSAGYYEAYYRRAMQLRRVIAEVYRRAFREYDMLLLPAASAGPPKLGAFAGDTKSFYEDDRYHVGANLAGVPAIAFPAGQTEEGMPVGLQLVGDHFREQMLLNAVCALEESI